MQQSPLPIARERKPSLRSEIVNSIDRRLYLQRDLVNNLSKFDTVLRMASYLALFIKSFNLTNKKKTLQWITSLIHRLSITRYIVRRASKWQIIRTLIFSSGSFSDRYNPSRLIFIFRLYIMISDFNDILQYFIVLDLFDDPEVFRRIRKWNNYFYLFQCFLWTLYYVRLLWRGSEETKGKLKETRLFMIKHVIDLVLSCSRIAGKDRKLSQKTISVLGIVSTTIAVYLCWWGKKRIVEVGEDDL